VPERPIIVFDVSEAPLGLQAIRPVFDRIFSDPAATCLWFPGLITYSEALRLADVYVPFSCILPPWQPPPRSTSHGLPGISRHRQSDFPQVPSCWRTPVPRG
jgi:hypothetical protein